MNVDFPLKISIYFITSSDEIDGTNGRMMTDLLPIDWAAIDKSLESLSQNGIEGFFNIKVQNTVSKGKSNTVFESFNGVIEACPLNEVRC
jgi:hypothetical protein